MHPWLVPFLAAPLLVAQAPKVQQAPLAAHLGFLAHDLAEGRGTGSRGGQLAVAYLEAQLRALGLQPIQGDSYRQTVVLHGIRPRPASSGISVLGDAGRRYVQDQPLKPGVDAVLSTGLPKEEVAVDAPLVFVGHGIQDSSEGWDDFKGYDCRGKVLLVLVNDPPPTEAEPGRFGGRAMTYAGRWVYKYEQAARLGAAGVLLVHTNESATYGWGVVQNSFSGERFQAADRRGNPLEGWLTETCARRLLQTAGKDLDALREQAGLRDFRPVDLDLRVVGTLRSNVRRVEEANVAGVLPGRDPARKDEAVLYTAHWDHLGRDEALVAAGKDGIYNGAMDNASGCAGLLAMAAASAGHPPRRSQIFLFVCGEEHGLLGSTAWAAQAPWPLERTVAGINLDSLNAVGITRDAVVQGVERTTLGPFVEKAAGALGLRLTPAPVDVGAGYFRSDHFSLVLAGLPAVSIGSGQDFVQGAEAGREKQALLGRRYHQVDEVFDAQLDLAAMTQQAQFALELGYLLAETSERPRLIAPVQRP